MTPARAADTRRVRLTALDVRLDVVVDDVGLHHELVRLLRDLLDQEPRTGPADTLVVVVGAGPWVVASPGHHEVATTVAAVRSHVLMAVNLTLVASTRLLAVHAAVVARGARVLVLPARSGTGKSTLSACLLRAGWSYVSDEALAVRWHEGTVVPYPRPLTLSPWSARTAGLEGTPAQDGLVEERVVVCGEHGDVANAPGTVTDVVLVERDGSGPRLAEVSGGEVVAELVRRSFTTHLDPARALIVLAGIAAGARLRRLHLGDPVRAAALLSGDHGD